MKNWSRDEIELIAERTSDSLSQSVGVRPPKRLVVELIETLISHDLCMEGDILEREVQGFVSRLAEMSPDIGDRGLSLGFWLGHAALGMAAIHLLGSM